MGRESNEVLRNHIVMQRGIIDRQSIELERLRRVERAYAAEIADEIERAIYNDRRIRRVRDDAYGFYSEREAIEYDEYAHG